MFWLDAVALSAAIAGIWVFLFVSIDERSQANPRWLGASLERRLRVAKARCQLGKRSTLRLIVLMQIVAVLGSAVALWWFLLPDSPGEAFADSLKAAGAAVYAELWISRQRL